MGMHFGKEGELSVSRGFTQAAGGGTDLWRYSVVFTLHRDEELGSYGSFGVCCTNVQGQVLWRCQDLSLQEPPLCRLVELLNCLQPSPLHLPEIVQDFLAAPEEFWPDGAKETG